MIERPISIENCTPMITDEALEAVNSALSALQIFAPARDRDVATQHPKSPLSRPSLASRYAAANSITRRRFDALLQETEGVARAGLGLVVARGGRQDRGTIAAARFLGNSITASLRRLDNLLPAEPA